MDTVSITRIPWSKVRRGMTVFWSGKPVVVEWIGTTKAGHRRVTIHGRTHTVRSYYHTGVISKEKVR